jgi:aromatic ring-opening dioxygenase catalytic subunit (LigB family)
MAELVGVFAASHGPLIARDWDCMSSATRNHLREMFDDLGRRVRAAKPDVLVVIAPDHWTNFFLNNLPAFCIGIGDEHDGPPEPFMRRVFPHRVLPGQGALARHLLRSALAASFDPAFSHRIALDHGYCVPLWRLGLEPLPAIVPIVVNSLEEPMPSLRRCLEFGSLLGTAIASFPGTLRVALLSSGGLSHSIGEPTMGMIDEAFDRLCIDLLCQGTHAELCASLEEALQSIGNGAHEVRNWIVGHAAAGNRHFDLVGYEAMPEVYMGFACAEWTTGDTGAFTR